MSNLHIPHNFLWNNNDRELSDREKAILRAIVQMYILTAAPIGSRFLSKYLEHEFKLSPATIRNVMSDLEEQHYICHPHTSAGRVPTDKGYRFYVDSLMEVEHLSVNEINELKKNLTLSSPETLLRDASRVLSSLSRYLGVVEIPQLLDLIVRRVELIELSSTRILVVLALESDIVRTVTLEASFEIDYSKLDEISRLINQRVSGRPLSFLKKNFSELISDVDHSAVVRLFADSVEQLFSRHSAEDRLHFSGTQNLLNHPEFEDLNKIRGIIELIEDEDVIVHILDRNEEIKNPTKILIGSEMEHEVLDDYALIVSNYQIGSASGSIGVIGPKRMNYSKIVSLVQQVVSTLSHHA